MESAIILLYSIAGSKLASNFLKAEDLVLIVFAPVTLLLDLACTLRFVLALVGAFAFGAGFATSVTTGGSTSISVCTDVSDIGRSVWLYCLKGVTIILCHAQ
ncbi:MAG: hypothetical protein ACO2YY_04840 [Pseudohongiellaceae bacterium]